MSRLEASMRILVQGLASIHLQLSGMQPLHPQLQAMRHSTDGCSSLRFAQGLGVLKNGISLYLSLREGATSSGQLGVAWTHHGSTTQGDGLPTLRLMSSRRSSPTVSEEAGMLLPSALSCSICLCLCLLARLAACSSLSPHLPASDLRELLELLEPAFKLPPERFFFSTSK